MASCLADQLAVERLVSCRGRWPLLRVDAAAITNPAAFLETVGVLMRPMHKTAQIVPFVHTAHVYPVAHPERYAFGEVNVVSDQQRPAATDVDDEALVSRSVAIIRQQPPDEACYLDPAPVITLGIHPGKLSLPLMEPS